MMKEYIYSDNLMGTELDISVISNKAPELEFEEVKKIFQRYENIFSRFKASSELSRLNSAKELIVSQEFIEVFLLAKAVYLFTNGLINPLCNPSYLGYEYSFDELANYDLKKREFGNIDFGDIALDLESRKITLKENQNLDFGGLLKGYVAELVCSYLRSHEGVIVNLGGDIFTIGVDLGKKDFAFELANPFDVNKSLGILKLHNQALTTSSVIKRNWLINGEKYNHIVDPRSKQSINNNIASVSVVHDKGMYADALAKVGLILGVEEGMQYYEKNEIAAIFVLNDLKLVQTKLMKKYFN